MLENSQVIEKTRREVAPTLIREQISSEIGDGHCCKTAPPPRNESQSFRAVTNRRKSKVEDSRLQHVIVVGVLAIFYRARDVWGQNHRATSRQLLLDSRQSRINADVWVEVDDRVQLLVLKQPLKHVWLHGRVEFHDVVANRHVIKGRDTDGICLNHRKWF